MEEPRNMAGVVFAKSLYSYSAEEQELGLPFVVASVIIYLEDRGDGWSKGAVAHQEGWFPTSYVQKIPIPATVDASRLAAVIRSSEWMALSTDENKIYFVNRNNQETSWAIPSVALPRIKPSKVLPPTPSPEPAVEENGVRNGHAKGSPPDCKKVDEPANLKRAGTVPASFMKTGSIRLEPELTPATKARKAQQYLIGGVTFPSSDKDQKPLVPGEAHLCDYFWGDSPEVGTGFDVVLQTSIVGRAAIGEMADFMKERALIEDQYAKSLMKLSKSTFGEQEEGTLNRAWQMVKAELGERAKFHSAFANDLSQEVERPLLEYKPTLKLGGKEHVPVIEQNRKILRDLDALHEKAKSTPNPNPGTRRSTKSISMEELKNLDKKAAKKLMVDDSVRILQAYNEELSTYTDNMIQALQEMEQQEETRFDCLKKLYLRYIEVNVRVNESIAMALQKVHDSVDSMQVQADREFFIRKYGTGRVRPVERDPNMDLIREV